MAKNNTNGSGAGDPTPPTIHLILQGKGGIGKSVVASWLAEFLIGRGQPVCCIDGDPVNRSLGQYKALAAEKLDLVNKDGVVMRSRYDSLTERFLKDESVFVVDSGATAFLPFWTYIVESDIITVLREAGRRVYIHIPISGGEMLNDSLLGFSTLAETAVVNSLVVWINEYFGPVASDGKTFDQMQVYLDNREKVLTSIEFPAGPRTRLARTLGKCAKESSLSKRRSGLRISTSWRNHVCSVFATNCSNNWSRLRSREAQLWMSLFQEKHADGK